MYLNAFLDLFYCACACCCLADVPAAAIAAHFGRLLELLMLLFLLPLLLPAAATVMHFGRTLDAI